MPKISLEAVRVNAVNWEKGKTEPTLSQLRKMSELSGIPMDFIFVPNKFN